MGRLILVRHGQASFLSDDYDRLSERGLEQSRLLGQFWSRNGVAFSRAISGPRRRHQETAGAVVAAYGDAGVAFPEVEVAPALDEFDWDGLMQYASLHLLKAHPRLLELHGVLQHAVDNAARRRAIQKYMEALMALWVRGEFESSTIESWPEFCARVYGAIAELTAEADSGANVVVFTSGGTAAVVVQRALDHASEKTLELIWTLRNGALVEFLFTRERFSLGSFNDVPHLPDPAYWTYR
ncbi:MAG: histidine phosphatase family protein [Candidatus Hydrogenedentes bacterium]|nr:histidine phosphatase family protein [Candidatus Hydrogenedentota bacterium]